MKGVTDREAMAVLVKKEHCRPKQEKVQRLKVGLEGPPQQTPDVLSVYI